MRIQKKFLVLGMIVLLAAGGAVIISGTAGKLGKGGAARARDVYYCPMHPTYTSDRPGTCPICNMNLVKKEITPEMPEARQVDKHLRDICIMHNCHKSHDGKPCPMMVLAKEGEKVTCPICGTHVAGISGGKKEKKILFWTDPMIPGYKADKPGKSPMGMDLIPVYEEETVAQSAQTPQGYAPIMLSPQKQQLIGIKTAAVEKKKLIKTVRTVGTIAHDPELYQAQTEYIQAIQAFERAKQSDIPEIVDQSRRLVESTRIRLRHMGLNDDLISEIAAWKEAERSLLFTTPGEPVWVYAPVYEYELPLIHVGQEIMAEVPSLSNETFQGTIRAVDSMVDQATRTTRVRAQLKDPQGRLRPDMYVNVSVDVDLGETPAIPEGAVFDTGTKKIVFVDKGQGVLEPRDITVGAKADGYYELKSGVQEGEIVVTSGNFLIDSESRLKAALEGMSGSEGGHQHGQ
ncbi:MAG: efflux RND transporter periplasmic adaptor subunit [Candidatus Omnitrophica bacterium]|nr:efflux RND transporter periplasmic adaptor subunit [Candidatus Omnitrophota bacterium]